MYKKEYSVGVLSPLVGGKRWRRCQDLVTKSYKLWLSAGLDKRAACKKMARKFLLQLVLLNNVHCYRLS